jgi:hypothetical protein
LLTDDFSSLDDDTLILGRLSTRAVIRASSLIYGVIGLGV